ncbi:MAG: histidine phosphatase family protein [Clostridia bacterium]|nr:histidine phosphatase family protein [Clostridia bacterium]
MVDVIIVRHGQTRYNKSKACLGRENVAMTETGQMDAGRLAMRMKGIYADVIYSSPLMRARNTAGPYLGTHGTAKHAKLVVEPALIERDWGEWEGMSLSKIKNTRPDEYAEFMADWLGYVVPGGESFSEVQERVNAFLDRIMPENDGKTVYLSTHLGTARHIISHLLGLRPEESRLFWMDNATYTRIEYDNKTKTGTLKCLGK